MLMPAIMLSTMSLALEQHAWAYWAKHFGLATTHLVLRLCLIKVESLRICFQHLLFAWAFAT